jgi:hypothetical protein
MMSHPIALKPSKSNDGARGLVLVLLASCSRGSAPPGGASDASDSGPLSTQSILAAQAPDCLDCVMRADCFNPTIQGGVCETVQGKAAKGSLTEKELCLKVLAKIFSSKCGINRLLTECLCGKADNMRCLAGKEAPKGPLYQDYLNDWPLGGVDEITSNFVNLNFGAGMANGLAQCALAFGCDTCFAIKPSGDGGTH